MFRFRSLRIAGSLIPVVIILGLSTAPARADRATTYTYNDQGLISTIDGPRTDIEDTTTYEYDAQGNRQLVRNALAQETQVRDFDSSGRPLRLIDPNGLITEFTYDYRGHLTSQSLSDGTDTRTTVYAYDPAGNLIRVSAPDGSQLNYEYDANHIIAIEDGAGNRIDYTLDAMDNRLDSQVSDLDDVLRYQQQQVYNQLGRLIQTIGAQAQVTGYEYDANGNLTQATDARENPTRQSYDALDRLARTTDALDGITRYTYDAQDNLTSTTDPNGLTTTYEYDSLGNLLSQTSPDTGTTTYTYDEAGNRLSRSDDRGITVTYEYDALNRLTAVHYPDSSLDVAYRYDQGTNGIGRLTTMKDAQGTTNFSYNAFGQLLSKTRSESDGFVTIFSYDYDAHGRLSGISYPSGRFLSYGYDSQGLINRVTLHDVTGAEQPLATNIQRLPFGPVQTLTFGNGLSLSRSYDLDYRLVGQTITGIIQSSYGYDPAGNIIQWQELLDIGRDQRFDYDELDRLISASGAYGELAYSYDATGNRLSLTDDSASETYRYAPDSHRLQQILGSVSDNRSYDAVGNTIESLAGRYSYDESNRLVGYSKGKVKAVYAYNGRGERIRKTVTSGKGAEDYLALAEAAQAQAEAYRAQAESLAVEVQSARVEADRLNGEADNAVARSAQKTLQAQALTQAANKARQAADALSREAADLQAKAAAYRARIKADPGNLQERLKNSYYESLAEAAEKLATKANEEAGQLQIKAEDLDQQAQANRSEASTLAQQAESQSRQAKTLLAKAEELETQAQTQRQLADAAQAQADEYRRLAENTGDASETTTRFAYDEQGQLIGEYAEDGSPIREYVYLENQPLALLTKDAAGKEAVYYLHTDHLGAVVKATDADQALIWDVVRRPYGQRKIKTAKIEIPPGLAGQYYDQESGNYYNYFRDYDPSTGRYLQSDPIGLRGGINTYAYVRGRPINAYDVLGLDLVLVGQGGASGSMFSLAANTWVNQHGGGHQVVQVNSGLEAIQAMQNYAATNGGIDGLQVFSHSGSSGLYFDSSGSYGSLYSGGAGWWLSPFLHNAATLGQIDPAWFNNNANVQFFGCNTANGSDSFAEQFADHIGNGISVTGSQSGNSFSGLPNGAPGQGLPNPVPSNYTPVYLVPEGAGWTTFIGK